MRFVFTILKPDYTLHKTVVFAESLNDAHDLWLDLFGDVPFVGCLNIKSDNGVLQNV